MDRRAFLLGGISKAGKTAVNFLDQSINIPVRWVRPPFALVEPEFLLSCTRCNACIDACPEHALFPLRAKEFPPATGTPALDVLEKACALCKDWPCVMACDVGALLKPDDKRSMPKFQVSLTVNEEICLPYQGPECGVCINACTIPGALEWKLGAPVINQTSCIGCGCCRQSCITQPKAISVNIGQNQE